jgi:hypothetical protein
LQLSTRCSSAALLLRRSLAVRPGSAANCFAAPSWADALLAASQLHQNNIARSSLRVECIVEIVGASIQASSVLHSGSRLPFPNLQFARAIGYGIVAR